MEMNVALDTNAYTEYARGNPHCVQVVRTARQVHLPLIVLGELHAGFAGGSRATANIAILRRFIHSPRVSVLVPDEQTAHHYGYLYIQLRKQGTPIPTNDLWIAALVVQHNLVLCTSDAHFQHLPQLARC